MHSLKDYQDSLAENRLMELDAEVQAGVYQEKKGGKYALEWEENPSTSWMNENRWDGQLHLLCVSC